MDCSYCGAPAAPGCLFCQSCGQPLEMSLTPAVPSSKASKKKNIGVLVMSGVSLLLAILLVLSLTGVLGGASGGSSAFAASKSFSTPEDAIEYFVDRLTAGDWEGALAACAVNEIAENYDYEAMIERLQTLLPNLPCLPSEYQEYAGFNNASVRASLLRQMAWLTFSVTLPDEYDTFLEYMPTYEGIDFDDVVEDMDPASVSGLKLMRIDSHAFLETEQNEENYERQAAVYGADAQTSRVVLYEYDGDYYAGGFTLLQYNGRWLISWLNDPLAGIPVTGALLRVDDEDAFEDMLG